MPVFKGSRENTDEILEEIRRAVEEVKPYQPPTVQQSPVQPIQRPVETPKEQPKEIKPETKEEKPTFAPLFVKLDRYKQILTTMNYVKTALVMVKNSLSILDELDKIRSENLSVVRDALDKVEKSMLTLDSEFLRPSGFHEETSQLNEVASLSVTIDDLKGQIEQLKSELGSMR